MTAPGGRQFVEPTIFTGVDNTMRIAQEEVFGPVLSVVPFDTEEDAVRIGNDVNFGLAAGVWTPDIGRAIRMSEQLQVGTVWVNTYRAVSFISPFGGYQAQRHRSRERGWRRSKNTSRPNPSGLRSRPARPIPSSCGDGHDSMTYDLDHPEIREAVTKLCVGFPGEYWRRCDREQALSERIRHGADRGRLSCGADSGRVRRASACRSRRAAAILEEIHRAGCNAAACHAQMYTMGTLLRHGSDAQKAQYLPDIANGSLRLQAFGVTEPTSGTDTTALRTTARLEGDMYIVNGQKIWTSRAEHSDLMLMLCRTTPRDQCAKKTDGLSVFLVDMRDVRGKSLTIRPIRAMMNHATTELFFDGMPVPAANLIGEEGRGFRYILSGMNAERILISAECVGDAKWFTERATAYANERCVFGRPIGQNQGIQFPIAKAYSQMRASELMLREAILLYEAGGSPGEEANLAKMLTADASWAAAEACLQTHGGFGFAEEYDVERKYREARLYQVAPISTNLILSYIAEHVLGMPRSY